MWLQKKKAGRGIKTRLPSEHPGKCNHSVVHWCVRKREPTGLSASPGAGVSWIHQIKNHNKAVELRRIKTPREDGFCRNDTVPPTGTALPYRQVRLRSEVPHDKLLVPQIVSSSYYHRYDRWNKSVSHLLVHPVTILYPGSEYWPREKREKELVDVKTRLLWIYFFQDRLVLNVIMLALLPSHVFGPFTASHSDKTVRPTTAHHPRARSTLQKQIVWSVGKTFSPCSSSCKSITE